MRTIGIILTISALLLLCLSGCGRKAETIRVKLAEGGASLAGEGPAGRARELFADFSQLAGAHLSHGLMLYRCNEFDSCRQVLGAILTDQPSDWQAHYLLGLIEFRWANYDSARESFQSALLFAETDKKSRAAVYAALASTFETLSELGKARQHYLTAYNLDPGLVIAAEGLQRLTVITDSGSR